MALRRTGSTWNLPQPQPLSPAAELELALAAGTLNDAAGTLRAVSIDGGTMAMNEQNDAQTPSSPLLETAPESQIPNPETQLQSTGRIKEEQWYVVITSSASPRGEMTVQWKIWKMQKSENSHLTQSNYITTLVRRALI